MGYSQQTEGRVPDQWMVKCVGRLCDLMEISSTLSEPREWFRSALVEKSCSERIERPPSAEVTSPWVLSSVPGAKIEMERNIVNLRTIQRCRGSTETRIGSDWKGESPRCLPGEKRRIRGHIITASIIERVLPGWAGIWGAGRTFGAHLWVRHSSGTLAHLICIFSIKVPDPWCTHAPDISPQVHQEHCKSPLLYIQAHLPRLWITASVLTESHCL